MAGIERRVYPHLLRHSYIMWAIRRGIHPFQIRQIVGHESTAMIDRVYSHLVPQDAYAATMKDVLRGRGRPLTSRSLAATFNLTQGGPH